MIVDFYSNKSVFRHKVIMIISPSVLYFSLPYYIVNPCISAFIRIDDCFSMFTPSSYNFFDNKLVA
ncbi:HLJ1_G0055230.mRNA.1.CDS.1 [Saccharomyces cerevisiae]|nr:HLJ1_G0055230.mRNA.1.CDS.1 [Saccharomyces cerevisiae]